MRVLWAAIAALSLGTGGGHQGVGPCRHGDPKCLANGPLLSIMPAGPTSNQNCAAVLYTTRGVAVNDVRAATKTCNLIGGGTATMQNNQISVEAAGIRTDSGDSITVASTVASGKKPSWSADFKADALGSTQFLVQLENAGNDRWDMFIQGGGQIGCDYFNGSGFTATTVVTITGGTTHHASCSYDGANMKVCLDGTCVSSARSFAASATNYTVAIGRDVANNGTPLAGWVNKICVDSSNAKCT